MIQIDEMVIQKMSWDSIMEVVEWIETQKNGEGYGYQVDIQNNACQIESANHLTDGKRRILATSKKEAVLKALFMWLRENNSNKQP